MASALRALARRAHAAPHRAVVVATGGASTAISTLASEPGCSKTLIEAVVPYATESLDRFVGGSPASYASEATARRMAAAALSRAVQWRALHGGGGVPVVGVAATAALTSRGNEAADAKQEALVGTRRGEHRVYVAVLGADGHGCSYNVVLDKTVGRSRLAEELLASHVVLQALVDAGRSAPDFVATLRATMPEEWRETDAVEVKPFEDHVPRVLFDGDDGDVAQAVVVTFDDAGLMMTSSVDIGVLGTAPLLLSGSFNPVHDGHVGMLAAASALKPDAAAAFELSVRNADKGLISIEALLGRLAKLASPGRQVLLTRQGLFVDKARLVPGATFVVGYDTAARILEPRYYDGGADGLVRVLDDLRAADAHFLVAGRLELRDDKVPNADGRFLTLADLGASVPSDLFSPLDFRSDLSSSAIRKGQA